ncbi:hypothetical protein OC834_001822 [Tilletia horrida]|uniref:Hydrophobic surface binding protein A n=1 Tax=Tilletia horrida TaxID=155126 RepID=A0AAN6GFY7_9BASI|nr:hypothetical protein OC835_006408 [Tilletia horrida]KAK0534634.1 hypothetical protein OC834_001822 [Tilletia horrida]KAK0535767.1 hypothetical protein OC842_002200 [Tilletia horrida]KAK0565950.1 hypothetical protein OC844_000988 [Tilletia horrida]
MKFTAAFVAVTALVAGVTADYAKLKSDVEGIKTDVAKLYTDLKDTDGTSYSQALAIDSAAKALNSDIENANREAKAVKTVSNSQAKAIIHILSGTYKDVSLVSKRLIALEPSWKKLGIAAIAKGDISSIAASTKTFGATLVSKAPKHEKKAASELAGKYNKALAAALAAYSSD